MTRPAKDDRSELDMLRAKAARVEALDFRMRRLGAASDDPEVAGWNHALNVAQDDLRAALVGATDSSCEECDDLAEHEAAARHAAGDPRWEKPQEHREPSGYFGGGGGLPRHLPLPIHRTEAGCPNCSTCDGGGCLDCTDPA